MTLTLLAALTTAAVLGPRLPALVSAHASRRGSRSLTLLALGVAALLARRRALGANHAPALYYALAVVAGCAAARRRRDAKRGVSVLISLAAAPAVMRLVTGDDADVPACLAMVLGLLMDHAHAAAVILLMVTGGEALEELALDRAGTALRSLLADNPGTARLESSGGTTRGGDVPAELVVPGDVLLVRPNEVVAVDGTLMDEAAPAMDEKLITGEAVAGAKRRGDVVFAGSVNRGASAVRVRASKRYEESVVHLMRCTLRAALEKKSRVELGAKRIADGLTPLTLLVACAGFEYATRWLRRSPVEAWKVVLSVLMSATPCPAAIGVPVAMLSGMSQASRRLGTTIKSGDALEAMCDARCVVFDKTGTLTFGVPVVVGVVVESSAERGGAEDRAREALRLVASLERVSKHVLADAVYKHYTSSSSSSAEELLSVAGFEEVAGLGVSGVVGGEFAVRVGAWTHCFGETGAKEEDGELCAFFAIRRVGVATSAPHWARGRIRFEDPVRPGASAAVAKLRARGIAVAILSGDRSAHLKRVAAALGVDSFQSCLPHEKARRVQELQRKFGVVMFVGDGANDSAALAQADVGVSVDASSLASEAASVVVLNGDVRRVDDLIGLSQRVVRIARRTVRVGTAASLVQMAAAALGATTPFQNAVAQELIDLCAVLHSMAAVVA